MYLNTSRAIDLVNRLEMIKGNNDIFNNYELKFLKKQEEDKVHAQRVAARRQAYAAGYGSEEDDNQKDEYAEEARRAEE